MLRLKYVQLDIAWLVFTFQEASVNNSKNLTDRPHHFHTARTPADEISQDGHLNQVEKNFTDSIKTCTIEKIKKSKRTSSV